jgi:hypothetical protein
LAKEPKKPRARSRVSNGKFPPGDRRSAMSRRFEDLTTAYLGGLDEPLDEGTLALARSAAMTTMRLERIEARAIEEQEIDDERLVRLAGFLGRTLTALNALKAKARPSGDPRSNLQRHLEEMAQRKAEAEKARQAEALATEGTAAHEAR